MNEEELYKLAISDVSTYSLLNEILAIRDKRFPNEEVEYCINVNGYISLDVLNKYVKVVQENQQLKEKIILLKCAEPMLELTKEYGEKNLYKQRIDKAIEYIEWQRDNPQYDNVWRSYECDGLLKILKGEENE